MRQKMLDLCIDLIDPQHGYHWFVLRSHHCPPAVITIINSILIQYHPILIPYLTYVSL